MIRRFAGRTALVVASMVLLALSTATIHPGAAFAQAPESRFAEARLEHQLVAVRAPSAAAVDRALPTLRAEKVHHSRHYGSLTVDDLR